MNAREYLEGIRKTNVRLACLASQRRHISDALQRATGTLSETPRSETRETHRLEAFVAAKVDIERQMEDELETLKAIYRTLDVITDSNHKSVLTLRYAEGESWHAIASAIGVGVSRVYSYHSAALEEVERILKNFKNDSKS